MEGHPLTSYPSPTPLPRMVISGSLHQHNLTMWHFIKLTVTEVACLRPCFYFTSGFCLNFTSDLRHRVWLITNHLILNIWHKLRLQAEYWITERLPVRNMHKIVLSISLQISPRALGLILSLVKTVLKIWLWSIHVRSDTSVLIQCK